MSWYDLIDKNGTAVIPDGTVEIPENVYSHCGTLKVSFYQTASV